MTILHDATTGEGIGQSSPLPTKVIESTIMQPVDIQGRYSQTIQTHNAVSVPGSTGVSMGTYFDASGFLDIAITLMNASATNSSVELYWSHDGITNHGYELILPTGNLTLRSASTPIKARYIKVALLNTDATARIMSAWAYLKA